MRIVGADASDEVFEQFAMRLASPLCPTYTYAKLGFNLEQTLSHGLWKPSIHPPSEACGACGLWAREVLNW